MYSFRGATPQPLPQRIRLSDGTTRTDSSTFTEQELLDAGYAAVPDKPQPGPLQKVVWAQSQWQILDLTSVEIENLKQSEWAAVRQKRNQILQETDWIILKAMESGEGVDNDFVIYRQALRDLTRQQDPFNIVWPTLEKNIDITPGSSQ